MKFESVAKLGEVRCRNRVALILDHGRRSKNKHLEQVLHVFRQSSDALSAGMLLDALANEISKSTVYRMLQKLEDDGVIHSFLTMDQIRFYALQGLFKWPPR